MRCHRLMVLVPALLPVLGGCTHLPSDATSHYSYVAVPDRAGSSTVRYTLWPDACRSDEPPSDPPLGNGLPAGCANDYNLLHMVAREGDLVQGRRLGAAPAAPAVRAAQKYIDGAEGPLGAGAFDAETIAPPATDSTLAPVGNKPASPPNILAARR